MAGYDGSSTPTSADVTLELNSPSSDYITGDMIDTHINNATTILGRAASDNISTAEKNVGIFLLAAYWSYETLFKKAGPYSTDRDLDAMHVNLELARDKWIFWYEEIRHRETGKMPPLARLTRRTTYGTHAEYKS